MSQTTMSVTTSVPLWIPIAAALGGTVVGYMLGVLRDVQQEKRRVANSWKALYAEFKICCRIADQYFSGPQVIKAPSYRWPSIAYEHAMPELLSSAGLSARQAQDLIHYFMNVDAVNRGLDYAQDASMRGDTTALNLQFGVNASRIKKHLVSGSPQHVDALRVFTEFGHSG
jgi:hypothetical protein